MNADFVINQKNSKMLPKAKKSLGQHFLTSKGILERILKCIAVGKDDRVIEIGPGPGALTKYLLVSDLVQLILIELDDYWADFHLLANAHNSYVKVLHLDALRFPWDSLEGSWKIVGNLPYNVASPLMWDIVSLAPQFELCVFMVQKEVAERVCAHPGSRAYGALSVWIQTFANTEYCFDVKPGNFSPPPKVDSAVIKFTPRLRDSNLNPDALAKTIKVCFSQRRKQIRNILKSNGFTNCDFVLETLGINPSARPEELSKEIFLNMSEMLFINK